MSDLTAAPDLTGMLAAVRAGLGALSAQAGQIGQMRGMFDDEDGTIQAAVDAGEEAETGLEAAAAALEALLAPADGTARHPTAGELLAFRDDVATEIAALDRGKGEDEVDGLENVELDRSNAETLVELLGRAALAVSEPIEVAVHVDGGAVQGVTMVEEDARPVMVYVHDHDVDGHDGDPDDDPGLGHILFQNSHGDGTEACSLAAHGRGPWTRAPGAGPYFTTLRAEAARIDAAERTVKAMDERGSCS